MSQAGAIGEPEIEERHVSACEQLAGLGHRPGLAHDLKVGLRMELRHDRLADGSLVFHE